MKKSELRQLIREELSKLTETKFIAFYQGKQHHIEGKDLLDAKQKAIAYLKVPKSKQGLLSVKSQTSMDNQDFRFEGKINEAARSISDIASEIKKDWKQVSPYARPYLDAMFSLDDIDDRYGMDSGRSVVAYFLSNASQWKGDKAKEIKKELNRMLK